MQQHKPAQHGCSAQQQPVAWSRLRVAAELPGQHGGIAWAALLRAAPTPPLAPPGDEAGCLLWAEPALPQVRCHQRGQPIQLCGHGMLAGACHWMRHHELEHAHFDGGGYRVTAHRDTHYHWLTLARPTSQPRPAAELPRDWFDQPPVRGACSGPASGYRILEWPAGTDLAVLSPQLACIREYDGRALIATATLSADEVALRYFAPQYGNDEDAATGSACLVLADYWQRRDGRTHLRLHQRSAAGALFHTVASADSVTIGATVTPA